MQQMFIEHIVLGTVEDQGGEDSSQFQTHS